MDFYKLNNKLLCSWKAKLKCAHCFQAAKSVVISTARTCWPRSGRHAHTSIHAYTHLITILECIPSTTQGLLSGLLSGFFHPFTSGIFWKKKKQLYIISVCSKHTRRTLYLGLAPVPPPTHALNTRHPTCPSCCFKAPFPHFCAESGAESHD